MRIVRLPPMGTTFPKKFLMFNYRFIEATYSFEDFAALTHSCMLATVLASFRPPCHASKIIIKSYNGTLLDPTPLCCTTPTRKTTRPQPGTYATRNLRSSLPGMMVAKVPG